VSSNTDGSLKLFTGMKWNKNYRNNEKSFRNKNRWSWENREMMLESVKSNLKIDLATKWLKQFFSICLAVLKQFTSVTDSRNRRTYEQTELPKHIPRLRLVAWYSGRTLVFDRRTFPVLRSTCSWQWRITTYVGKQSAVDQSTRLTQPFILSG